jgi:hypothetical protein
MWGGNKKKEVKGKLLRSTSVASCSPEAVNFNGFVDIYITLCRRHSLSWNINERTEDNDTAIDFTRLRKKLVRLIPY